ncbi:hypothetical protein B0H14DRAFT_323762 [Mycena olivaceomarginata]|nr:hypothetical protein B0H14DRAFT_323762 [Mycena olivaceomarginata]
MHGLSKREAPHTHRTWFNCGMIWELSLGSMITCTSARIQAQRRSSTMQYIPSCFPNTQNFALPHNVKLWLLYLVWKSIITFPSLVGRAQFSAPSSSSLSSFHYPSPMEIHHLTFWPILGEPGGSTQNPLLLQKNWCFIGLAALEGHLPGGPSELYPDYLYVIGKCGTSHRLLREFATFDLSDLCRQMAINVSAHENFHAGMTQDRVLCTVLDWLRSFPDDPLPRQVLTIWERQANAMRLCPSNRFRH